MPTESGLEERTASAVESQRSSEALELFLKGASRESTRQFGLWAWQQLDSKPEGAALNMRQAARDLQLSRESIRRAVAFYLRFGRLIRERDYGERAVPGRPLTYRLHPAYRKADWIATSEKVAYLQPKTSKPCTSTSCSSDAPASSSPSPYPRNPQPNVSRALTNLLSADPDVILDSDRAVRLILARVREELRRWPIGFDRKERIITGVAVAVRARFSGPVRRGDAITLARGLVSELRGGERITTSLAAACRFGRYAVRAAAQRIATTGEVPATPSPRGRGEEPPNTDAGPVVPPAPPDSEEGGPAEPQWARFRPARNSRHPIGDPADLDRRRAELIARLEGVGHGQR